MARPPEAPTFRSPIAGGDAVGPSLRIADETGLQAWRLVGEGAATVGLGHAVRDDDGLTFSTSPDEWTVLQTSQPAYGRVIDLRHVRAILRLTGADARRLLAKVCALDLDDRMFPSGAAARTSVANTTTEIVRDDVDGEPSFLLVTSRSFAGYLHHVLVDQAQEFGVA